VAGACLDSATDLCYPVPPGSLGEVRAGAKQVPEVARVARWTRAVYALRSLDAANDVPGETQVIAPPIASHELAEREVDRDELYLVPPAYRQARCCLEVLTAQPTIERLGRPCRRGVCDLCEQLSGALKVPDDGRGIAHASCRTSGGSAPSEGRSVPVGTERPGLTIASAKASLGPSVYDRARVYLVPATA
jgi:hypothetical protein